MDRPRRKSIRTTLAILCGLLLLAASPFVMIGASLWATNGSWDFEGKTNLRYWLLLSGSRLERIGMIEPAGPARYSVSFEDGNFPGWSVAEYASRALPEAVIDAYAARCREMKFKITERTLPLPDRPPNATAGRLVCEIEPDLNAEFFVERIDQNPGTHVGIRVWGDR